jgi:phosphohistidine phosphatase
MEVYLLRHGIAENRRPGRPDAERRLTDEGKAKLQLVLARARQANVAPSLILTSPYARAVETAQIAAAVLGYVGVIEQTEVLVPFSSCREVWQLLRSHADEPAVLLAGHEPSLGEAASYLMGVPRGILDMKKGALARIDIAELKSEPRGVLQWLLTPKLAATAGG